MAEISIISEATKKQLLAEKQKIDSEVSSYINRQIMYKRFMFLIPIQLVLYIPFLAVTSFFFGTLSFNEPNSLWGFLLSVVYVVSMNFFIVWEMRSRYKRLCKPVCLYVSVSSAEALEKGNMTRGSFFAVKLFEFIKPFSEVERVKLGHFKCSVKELFLGDIENLHEQRRAVGKAILTNQKMQHEFSNNLYILASSLFSEVPLNIEDGVGPLRFFANASKEYFEPATFLQKHKKVGTTAKVLTEIGKITLVPVLLFVFWIAFGYN